jgi:hypothetical protein
MDIELINTSFFKNKNKDMVSLSILVEIKSAQVVHTRNKFMHII